jgi:hypothetical protein
MARRVNRKAAKAAKGRKVNHLKMPNLDAITDALAAAQKRGLLPTALGTAELRELGEQVLATSVFTARGTNAVFVDQIKKVVDQIASGDLDAASARLSLLETLRALGYTPEGGFPDAPAGGVPPAIAGTLQDIGSKRRLDIIIETQRGLMIGAGQQMRGTDAERLRQFPAWELVRQLSVEVPRDWRARWQIAGGQLVEGGRMVALKGDPIWGELGSWQNFDDALGVDFPPFAFNSGMGWEEVSRSECQQLGITGPNSESIDDFLGTRPQTINGRQPLPAPKLSLADMDPAIRRRLVESTGAAEVGDMATTPAGRADLERREAERELRRQERIQRATAEAQRAYERRSS